MRQEIPSLSTQHERNTKNWKPRTSATLITNWIAKGGQDGGLESEAAIHSEDNTLKSGAIYLTLNELQAHHL